MPSLSLPLAFLTTRAGARTAVGQLGGYLLLQEAAVWTWRYVAHDERFRYTNGVDAGTCATEAEAIETCNRYEAEIIAEQSRRG